LVTTDGAQVQGFSNRQHDFQHAPVRQRDFTRVRVVAAAYQPGMADGVMRRAEGSDK
jgi:hypothetical protein